MKRIALLAGAGRLPIIFSDEARKNGAQVIALAIKGLTSPEIEEHVDKVYWDEITEGARVLEILKNEKINYAVMTGKVPKTILFNKKLKFDSESTKLLKNTIDKKDYAILKMVASRLGKIGVRILDSTLYLKKLLLKKGVLTSRVPSEKEWQDINFGKKIAKELAGMDIGQTVVVKDKAVLALEAIEGTDRTIKRGGELGKGDVVVVKVARPRQDMRFDVPAVGPETIDSLIKGGAKVLAIEAKKTLVVEKEKLIEKANNAGITVVAI